MVAVWDSACFLKRYFNFKFPEYLIKHKTKMIVHKLKDKLKKEGRSLKWFHSAYIEKQVKITYNALALQLNGYAMLSEDVTQAIRLFLKD